MLTRLPIAPGLVVTRRELILLQRQVAGPGTQTRSSRLIHGPFRIDHIALTLTSAQGIQDEVNFAVRQNGGAGDTTGDLGDPPLWELQASGLNGQSVAPGLWDWSMPIGKTFRVYPAAIVLTVRNNATSTNNYLAFVTVSHLQPFNPHYPGELAA